MISKEMMEACKMVGWDIAGIDNIGGGGTVSLYQESPSGLEVAFTVDVNDDESFVESIQGYAHSYNDYDIEDENYLPDDLAEEVETMMRTLVATVTLMRRKDGAN